MNKLKRISKVFEAADEILFDDSSRIILMSDVHRGDGSWADDFSKNQNLYFAALNHYYNENYTYIEIGDGDELWENKNLSDIVYVHSNAFWLLSKFYNDGRLYFIFGNHDMAKRNEKFVVNNMYQYYDERENKYIPLFKNIKIHEGLILKHRVTNDKILLIHGHQASFIDYDMWRLTRFLVRYLWRPLELFGVNDPTSTAKNYEKKDAVERKLTEWVMQEKHMLIAGHTHRPMFPEVGEPLYFNDGSSIHPRCITGIEIADGNITLVKWNVKTKDDGTLFIGREVLAGPRRLKDYFDQSVPEINSHSNSMD
ncbi:MAG TPA: serine/threonine protein phosphatase [Desulfosporosinus sp.]|nr:serine/threonine protein phosphatase [Desulfosporosinus sp.]